MKLKLKSLGLIGIAVLLIIFSGKVFWTYLTGAPSTTAKKEVFIIKPNENTASIVSRLEKEGFIKNGVAFRILLKLSSTGGQIQAGYFTLTKNMLSRDVVKILTHGVADLWVTFIEGWRVEEIADLINKDFGIPKKEFLKLAREGYLFPDTYLIPKKATAQEIAQTLKNNFAKKFDETLIKSAKKQNLTQDEVVIIASIVEREARNDEERALIAGILLKRWRNDSPLEADATVQYALGYQTEEKSWWKKSLNQEDLKVDSSFNTRKNRGLPPAPIANPGLASIKAVIFSKESPYWYYSHDKQGKVYWAKTLEEHNENVAKYLR